VSGVINSRAILAGLHYYNGQRLVFRCTWLNSQPSPAAPIGIMVGDVANISEELDVSIELDFSIGLT